MAILTITIINPATGQPISGLTNVALYLGDQALQYTGGGAPGSLIGTMTEEGASGSYFISISQTNAYTIRVSGVANDEYTNVWIPAGDIASTTRLNELGTGTLGSGATEIGVNDPDSRYVGTNVQTILNEISGARAGVVNANIAWLYAKVDGWTPSDAEINALTGSGVVVADLVKLHALTATAALINQALTGASANVTAANLNALTEGGATTLHTHDARYYTESEINTLLGDPFAAWYLTDGGALIGDDSATDTAPQMTIQPGKDTSGDCGTLNINLRGTGTGDGGRLRIDVRPGITGGGAWGAVEVYGEDDWYEVVTEWRVGDLDFSNTQFLSQLDDADYGLMTRCFRELDGKLAYIWQSISGTLGAVIYDQAHLATKIGSGALGADVAYGTCTVGTTARIFARVTVPFATSNIVRVIVRIYAKQLVGEYSTIRLKQGAVAIDTKTITSLTYVWLELVGDVSLITLDSTNPIMLTLEAEADTNSVEIAENIIVEVTH